MINRPNKKNVSIQQVLTALLDNENIFPPIYLHQLSDLEGVDLEALRSIWPQIHPQRRFSLLEDLEELAEADTLVTFDSVARLGLDDPEPRVRTVAVRLLWEDEDPRLVPAYLRILSTDEDAGARAAAATALGLFVYLGELEEIDASILRQVEDTLIKVIHSDDEEPLVRRRALESMGFSGRKEVPPLLREAYNSGESDWIASALFAMGRSADQVWAPEIKRMLRSSRTNIQLEAVRAAGELQIESTRRVLLELLEEEGPESEVRLAAIWSLSQIGGEEVRETLEQIMEESEDEDEVEWVEKALDNLSFTEDLDPFGMFDLSNLGQVDRQINMDDEAKGWDEEDPDSLSLDSDDSGPSSDGPSRGDSGWNRSPHRRSP